MRRVVESFEQKEKYVVINELNFDADRDIVLDQLKRYSHSNSNDSNYVRAE